MTNSIPKVIHYCWFGRKPLPEFAKKCILSWKKYLPDYEIKEWNEDNFNVNIIPYTAEAYEKKKYAFVSDYARFYILYHHGGIYFDTDVEVVKSLAGIINDGPFMGFEQPNETVKQDINGLYNVAPGLGLGVAPGLGLYKELLDYYSKLHFIDIDERKKPITIVKHTTDVLVGKGLKQNNAKQVVAGVTIYPWDYFCPQSFYTGKILITKNTVTIHHYSQSWHSGYERFVFTLDKYLPSWIMDFCVMVKHLLMNFRR